jgi:ribose transport system substrate-binding protein
VHLPLSLTRPSRWAALLAALTLVAIATGCGSSSVSHSASSSATATEAAAKSDSGGGSSGVVYAKAQVAKYTPLITHFTAPGPALSGLKGKLTGKTVWYIPTFLQAPIFTADSQDLAQPLALTGAKVHVCNADSNPSTASSCINEAVKAHAAGIVADAMDDSFASSAFAAAIAAKIPVVATDNDDPQGFPKSSDVTTVDIGNPLDSRLAADWIIANSDGKANVLYAADNSNDGVVEAKATESEFSAKCPGCKVTDVTFGDETVNNLTTGVSSAMVKSPSINYVDGGYDAPSGIFALQGAKTVTGRRFTYITSTGQPPGLQRVAAGTQVADPGMDPDIAMWNTADALFRIILHQAPAHYTPGVRIFTKANIPSDTQSASAYASGQWYSNGAFKAMYTKLWGF